MKVLYYDCFSGISGDMNLGAMIDIGVDKNYLERELLKLNIKDYNIKINKDARKGISGTKVDVITQETHVQHFHRGLKEIKGIINDSELNDNVKNISINIFNKLGEAEAKIHNKNINEIEFHEVGAVDSIIDIVGAAICFDYLNVDKIMSSSVELGGGFVRCAHGLIPVPAPAVVELLTGVPIKMGAVPFETTTPTGAAILKTMVSEFTDKKTFIIDRAAYGIGNRDTDIPNVLRVFIGDVIEKENRTDILKCKDTDLSETDSENNINIEDSHFILECNIDDMNPEYYDYIMERLFEEGASDVYITPIIMKKERPAVKLSVLCSEDTEKLMREILLKETSTLGVRKYKVEKTMLDRVSSVINTVYGNVRIKISYYNGHKIKVKPEYDDCKKSQRRIKFL